MPKSTLHVLSALGIERLQPTGDEQLHSDGGGLYLFIRRYGAKEWIFRYSSPLTKQRRKQSLGAYPDTSLKEARRLASQKRDMLSQGLDPLVEAEKQLLEQTAQLALRRERQQSTVKAIFKSWKQAELQNRNDRGVEVERAFEKDVFPIIGQKPISEVSRQEVKMILDRPLRRNARRMANRLLSDLKQFFGYADDEELITHDPTRRLIKDRVGGKEKSRERYLSVEEVKLLFSILPCSGLKTESQHLIGLLLATGCRVNEILRARWNQVDWENRLFFIPIEHAKNGLKHTIYLSDFSLKHLRALQQNQLSDWIVPNRQMTGSVTRQVLTKQITDRQKKTGTKGRVVKNQTLLLPQGRWVVHDLRRTAATLMQELGVMPYIIKKCLNQKTDDKIIETYQRAELLKQQKQAYEKLGQFLDELNSALR